MQATAKGSVAWQRPRESLTDRRLVGRERSCWPPNGSANGFALYVPRVSLRSKRRPSAPTWRSSTGSSSKPDGRIQRSRRCSQSPRRCASSRSSCSSIRSRQETICSPRMIFRISGLEDCFSAQRGNAARRAPSEPLGEVPACLLELRERLDGPPSRGPHPVHRNKRMWIAMDSR